MTYMQIFFLVITILLAVIGALVFSSHLGDNLDRDMAPFTGEEFKPSLFSAIPFPMSFVFGLAAVIIFISIFT